MRMDQDRGFTPWTEDFLNRLQELAYTEETTRVYPDGRREARSPKPVYTHYYKGQHNYYIGMYDQEYPLYKYQTSAGHTYYETLQASPWSSGPVFFLALKDSEDKWIKESLWSDEEIENCIITTITG